MDVQVNTSRPKSKYALKREKRFIDLTQGGFDQEPQTIQAVMEAAIKREKKEIGLRDIIKERLYSKDGAECFHRGNPFALAFNRELNK